MSKLYKLFNNATFLLISLSIPAIYYLLLPVFYEPHDLHHVADIYQMYRAFASGQFPPRYGPDFLYGYGYPLFNFYYVVPFYLGALFYGITQSLTASYKFVFIFSSILSVIGMYKFLRLFVSKLSSIVGATLFLYTPYRAVQMYVRGAMGEAFALALLPIVLWALITLVRNKSAKNLALSSIMFSIFILTHNYLWALSFPFIVFLVILISGKRNLLLNVFWVGLSTVIALGLSAYWIIPALLEQKLVSENTPFPLFDHFPFIKQLIIPSWGYGSSVWGPGDEISFQIGIVNLAIVIATFILIISKRLLLKKISPLNIWAFIGFTVSFLFMNSRTYPIWQVLPFHDFVQFPWRLLIYTTLFTATLSAIFIELIPQKHKILKIAVSVIIIASSIFLTNSYFQPSKVFYKTDQDYLDRMFADRAEQGRKTEVSSEYLQYSEDYLLLPKAITSKPQALPLQRFEIAEGSIAKITEQSPVNWKVEFDAAADTEIVAHFLYFPGWMANINGKKLFLSQTDEGYVSFQVPKGRHELNLTWAETPIRQVSNGVSLATLAILLLAALKSQRYKQKNLTKK